jgi:diacylglycerol kinase family enzyme
MTRQPWLAIVNPIAGGGRSRVDDLVRRAGLLAERVVVTERPGHAADLAAGADGYAGILVAGGDGTVGEVLQGMDRGRQTLGVLPAGRGNSLARDLGVEPQRIDLLQVTFEDAHGASRCVLAASTVAVGYPVAVAELANRRFRFLRHGGYAAAAAVTWPRGFAVRRGYESGGTATDRLTGLLANNTRHVANFLALPRASLRDGVFDVMELSRGFVGQSVHNLSAMARWSYQPVRPIRASSARVVLDQPRTLLIDGELYPRVVSVHIRVRPSAVTCSRPQ